MSSNRYGNLDTGFYSSGAFYLNFYSSMHSAICQKTAQILLLQISSIFYVCLNVLF